MDTQQELYCHDCQYITPQGHDLTCSSCGSQFVEFVDAQSRQTRQGSQPVHMRFVNGTTLNFPEGPPPAVAMAMANLLQGLMGTALQPTNPSPGSGRPVQDPHTPPTGYQSMPDHMPGFARPRWDPVPYPLPPRTRIWSTPGTPQRGQDSPRRGDAQASPDEPGPVRITTTDDLAG
jgi:hypothetical protein